jgi:hypothetical protein
MRFIFALFAASLLAAPAFAKDTLKLNFPETQDLIKALAELDGSTRLDKDNAPVKIAYDFPAKTRMAIARDIKALTDAATVTTDAWKNYIKGAGITDETKETDEQKAKVLELLSTKQDVSLEKFDESDLTTKDNPIPPTTLTRLLPLIK